MKATLYILFCTMLLSALPVSAVQFSPTTGKPCLNCHPANYSMVHSPSISDVWAPNGSSVDKWNIPGFLLPIPPSTYSQGLSSGQGKNSFVTLKTSEGSYDDRLFINVTGFTVGKTYQLRYSVLSASIHYEAGNNSPFGGSATMQVFTTGQNPNLVEEQTTTFDASNRNKWVTRVITFQPTASTLQFKLTGNTSGQSAGYINFDIDKDPFVCGLPADQVSLNNASTVLTIFPSNTLNLLNIGTLDPIPPSAELVWKAGPNSSDPTLTTQQASNAPISNQNPADIKPYYAFYYNQDLNCYNVPLAQVPAEIKFMYQPAQVSLLKTYVALPCPTGTTDLTACLGPSFAEVRWFTNNTRSGSPVANPTTVPPGDYYAFYFEPVAGTYSLPLGAVSTSPVHVESVVGNMQVELTKTIIETPFKSGKLDLATVPIKSVTPPGAELVWKTNKNSTNGSLTPQQASSVGISNLDPANLKSYYAFYYSKDLDCHTASVSQAELNFMYVPKQVTLKQTNITVSCDKPTTDLTALVDNPLGSVLWYTNNTRAGLAFSDPTSAPAGDYYAFYFDSEGLSYSLPNGQASNAHVKVENPIMPGIPDLGPTMNINSLLFPPNGSKDFVVKMQNIKAENSNCSVFFKVSKLPGFTISYSTEAGQSNVNGGMANNNDFWTFTENGQYITVTSKNGIAANGYSYIGFKITRNANTAAGSTQNLSVSIAPGGGGGETNAANNQAITTLVAN